MKTTYVFNSDFGQIYKGSLANVAKRFSISYKAAHYALMSGRIIDNYYFSRDENFNASQLKKGCKALKTSELRRRNTKHLLNVDKIIALRKKKNLSREKLAILLSVSLSVLYDMEKSPAHNPSISAIMRLAKFHNVKIDELVNMDVFKIAQLPVIE